MKFERQRETKQIGEERLPFRCFLFFSELQTMKSSVKRHGFERTRFLEICFFIYGFWFHNFYELDYF